ncbi:MAG: imidazolonepropionase, partial [Terriglobales bacterium]
IIASMRATRGATVDELVSLARPRLQRMLAHGTTTVEIKTGYGLSTDSELNMLEAVLRLSASDQLDIVATFMPAHAVPPAEERHEYVRRIIEEMMPRAQAMLQTAASKNLPHFVDVFCDRGYFTYEDTKRIFDAGRKHGFALKVHADEFENLGATTLATEYGAVSADHLLNISDREIELLARSQTAAVLLPGTSFYLNLAEHAPARKMIEHGAVVALGSDFNPGSCHIFSLPMIFGLACLHLKMTAEESLTALTLNAAHAVGLGHDRGMLREGYRADITICDVASLEEIPYNLGWNPVATVIKSGVCVVSDKRSG